MLLPPFIRNVKHLPRLLVRHATSGPLAPAIRTFAISLLLWLLAFQYCRVRFWRDPHSAFFKSEHVYDIGYSEVRRTQAAAYLAGANATDRQRQDYSRAGSDPILCAAFVTVNRDKNYFAEAVASMLEGLTKEERKAIYLFTLFSDTEPGHHPDWRSPWVETLIDEADTYVISGEERETIKNAEKSRNFYIKGLFDYSYALKHCQSHTTAPYIAIFEDDILFTPSWLSSTLHALHALNNPPPTPFRSILPDAQLQKPWLYLRLFYTETSLMWQSTDYWYRNMPLAFGTASTAGLAMLLLLRRAVPKTRSHLEPSALAILSFITIPSFVALTFMIGPYSLHPLPSFPSNLVKMNQYGCCTQALVFPRTQLSGLLGYFAERVHGQTDSLIEEYADREGLDRFALGRQEVQHVGLVSSRDNLAVNSQSTWAFYFETGMDAWLRARHDRDVKSIPWDELRGKGAGGQHV